MRVHAALGLSVVLTPFVVAHAGPTIPQDVRSQVKTLVDERICPGVIIGLIDESGVSYYAEGGTSLSGGAKVDERTIFEIGSISKVFTAILLCDQVEAGKLSLDDPIGRFLPPDTKVPSRGEQPMTLRMLATHRSGLPRMPDNFSPADPENPYADYGEKDLFAFLSNHELRRDVGASYEYSNLAMGLLGQLLARESGKTYGALLQDRVARTMGLRDTCVNVKEADLPRFSDGHGGERRQAHWDFDALAGAGAIRSTASDMTRFLALNMGLDHCDIDAALKAAQAPRSETGSPDLDMALGWHIWKRHGAEIFWHNGGTAGFHSFCGFRPDKKLGVVVLANDSYNIDAIGLHALEPKFEMKEIEKSVRVDGKVLDRYVGWYLLNPSMRIEITRAGDTLKAQLTGQDAYSVHPIAENRFVYRVVAAELEFERAADGAATAVVLRQNGHDQRFERAPADFKPPAAPREISVDPKILASYVGVYQLAPGVEFDIQLKSGQLMARLTGQPSFPVFAESETTFFYKVVEAKLTFEKDATGKVIALTLHQHGRDQRAEKTK